MYVEAPQAIQPQGLCLTQVSILGMGKKYIQDNFI